MKEMVKTVEPNSTNPEVRDYLVCYVVDDAGAENKTFWNISRGRRATIDDIIENIDDINPHESFVISSDSKFNERITVYAFMKKFAGLYTDFNIDEYIDELEPVYDHNNYIDPSLVIANMERYTPIVGGNTYGTEK